MLVLFSVMITMALWLAVRHWPLGPSQLPADINRPLRLNHTMKDDVDE